MVCCVCCVVFLLCCVRFVLLLCFFCCVFLVVFFLLCCGGVARCLFFSRMLPLAGSCRHASLQGCESGLYSGRFCAVVVPSRHHIPGRGWLLSECPHAGAWKYMAVVVGGFWVAFFLLLCDPCPTCGLFSSIIPCVQSSVLHSTPPQKAQPIPVTRQRPLFDFVREAELVLHFFETMSDFSFLQQWVLNFWVSFRDWSKL